ncbi:hypothetical protein COT42_04540 [Candidatus Saganbacteria bacterium CG08_land_8_20_14_0_20_45_16]|uniref:Yip1 domain-containing protein n=1 Tax=Candidatus Saganbacteria bacterium CG08_land_8_20_14_0_20_45_16 TaxID=2014293 RepID=A0A2H0XXR3_UNCSA|nr:MAG: hypothetical protein COT42_04540 [Candidatus Saganbacteria bacterium CG08_land_8_20_14_0_20_45_16]
MSTYKIYERARDLLVNPRGTWKVIRAESVTIKELFINYATPLALIPAVANLIGMTIVGIRMPLGDLVRAPFLPSLVGGIVGYILNLLGVLVGGWVVFKLAPLFESKTDFTTAVKLVLYSVTPIWLVGIFSVMPGLSVLAILGLYAIYLLAVGMPIVLLTPGNKVFLFLLSTIVIGLLINIVLTMVIVGSIYGPMYMRMMAL